MPSHVNLVASPSVLLLRSAEHFGASAATFTYHVAGDDPGPWPQILGSIGLTAAAGGPANLVVVRNVAPGSVPQWIQRIEQGEMVVLEGERELAASAGLQAGKKHVVVRSIVDEHAPKLPIVWQAGVEIPVFERTEGRTSFRHRTLGRRAARSGSTSRHLECGAMDRRAARHSKATNVFLTCCRRSAILA